MPQLSWVYLALKRNEDALKLARQAANLLPPEKDVLVGNQLLTGPAEIEARTGGTADPILRRQLPVSAGGSVSIAWLKIDPLWETIRNDPGFQQLLVELNTLDRSKQLRWNLRQLLLQAEATLPSRMGERETLNAGG